MRQATAVTSSAGRQTPNWNHDGVRRVLEDVLTTALRRTVKIVSHDCRPCPFATLFPAEILTLRLDDGQGLSVFVKHLGPEQADHPEKQCRDREVRIYETLFGKDDLPVARFYGSSWNAETRRHMVFLEYVPDWNLKFQSIEHWFTAARRLAHLHAHFVTQGRSLSACEFLLRFDQAYLHDRADRALRVVTDLSPDLGAQLERVTSNDDRVVELLVSQPPTLVHNDLSPKNVLADRSSSPARICFVDWEMAGIGCGLLDLVHLKYGLDPANDRQMCLVYFEALAGTGMLPPARRDLERLIAACELHKTLYRLSMSKTWGLPIDKVSEWVSEAVTLRGAV